MYSGNTSYLFANVGIFRETYKWYHSHKAKIKINSVCKRFDYITTIELVYS